MTCGEGLALHAALPEKLSTLTAAMAGVLEHHMTSVPPAEPEYAAYATLVADYRALTATLQRIAERMASYRDLPMPAHDEAALTSAEAGAVFAAYVAAERETAALLQSWATRDEAMLNGGE